MVSESIRRPTDPLRQPTQHRSVQVLGEQGERAPTATGSSQLGVQDNAITTITTIITANAHGIAL